MTGNAVEIFLSVTGASEMLVQSSCKLAAQVKCHYRVDSRPDLLIAVKGRALSVLRSLL